MQTLTQSVSRGLLGAFLLLAAGFGTARAAEGLAAASPNASSADPAGDYWRAAFEAEPRVNLFLPPVEDLEKEADGVLLAAAEREVVQKKGAAALAILAKIENPSERALSDRAVAHFLNAEFAPAGELYKRLSREHPLSTHYYLGSGEMLFLLGKYREALVDFELGCATDRNDAQIPLWIGLTRARLRDWRASAEAFRAARELDAKDARTRLWLAHALALNGEADAALKELEETLSVAPDKPAVHLGLALLALQRGDEKAALNALQVGRVPIALSASAETTLRGPAFAALQRDGDFQKFLESLRRPPPPNAVAQAPPAANSKQEPKEEAKISADPAVVALVDKGNAAAKGGDLGQAIALYESALQLDTNNPKLLNNLGGCYLTKREFGKAASLLERARHLDPSYGKVYYNLGLAYQGLGWNTLAVETWKRGLIVDPKHEGMRRELAASQKP